jgi:glycosyltransferase involved in cell wall biosynthesis
LLEAVGRMDRSNRHSVVIIGGGPEYDSLISQAKSLDVNLQILGPLAPHELSDWYLKACFVVVPSRREGFGLVAAEAAASSRAVIGSRVGGLPQVIDHEVSGLLIEPGNVDELFGALGKININWGLLGPKQVAHLTSENHAIFLRQIYEK